MCHCVQVKQKLDHSIIDGEGLEYHISGVVVTGTWLRWYSMKNPNLWLFKDWQIESKILHYSNLVVTSIVHLIKYGGKSHNKILWKVRELHHEAILETLKCRADPVGSLDWIGREGERERVINWIQTQCCNLSPKTIHMIRCLLLWCVSDEISLNHKLA